ncbi:MAG: MCE family protein [Gordonia sp. (in: high G+C Gram-positive bacteria)]|uniref:MCE family protein n=1 Tax=Gordonia sp. (in: high G+C Gram-positive bacteria) TaxID=84139 RepID=UPI0039E2D281
MKFAGDSRVRRIGAAVALSTVVVAGASGCGVNLQQVPLPGGVDVGSHPREYKIAFSDILDLVPQSVVKMDGTPVGRVTKIEVPQDQWNAIVHIKVKNNVDLSDEAQAAVQQTNLLGEKFVALSEPDGSKGAPRQNPDQVIDTARTRTTTDIEQLLGALSLLLNGGGINQLQPIIESLNESVGADGGATTRSLLKNANTLIDGLNQQRDNILQAIDGVNTLSERANAQTEQIERILNELPAGVQVLNEQRPQFVELLTKLDKLGQVGTDILGQSHTQIVNDLKALRPILTELAKSADDAITATPLMLTHPFPDDLLPAVRGDSTNLFMTLDLRLLNQLEALGVGQGEPVYQPPTVNPPKVDPHNPYINGNGPRWGWPSITLLPPGANWKPGPNTPPSGGKYPLTPDLTKQYDFGNRNPVNAQSDAAKKRKAAAAKKKTKPGANPASSQMPAAQSGESFLDGTIAMMGGGNG